jgi:hypothetical protein
VIQENSFPEPGEEQKYEVGSLLKFVAYNPEEMHGYEEEFPDTHDSYQFKAGDLLRVAPRNGCGLGIDVIREADGHFNMVWPEEVVVVPVT